MDSSITMTVRYSCPECGIVDRGVEVRERRENEDVVEWVRMVMRMTCEDHAECSPKCHPSELKNLKIPLPPHAAFIGQVTRQ